MTGDQQINYMTNDTEQRPTHHESSAIFKTKRGFFVGFFGEWGVGRVVFPCFAFRVPRLSVLAHSCSTSWSRFDWSAHFTTPAQLWGLIARSPEIQLCGTEAARPLLQASCDQPRA